MGNTTDHLDNRLDRSLDEDRIHSMAEEGGVSAAEIEAEGSAAVPRPSDPPRPWFAALALASLIGLGLAAFAARHRRGSRRQPTETII